MSDVNIDKLCLGCLNENSEAVCKHCGFDETHYSPSANHLPLRTILNGKYLVGRVLGEGGFGITYIGMDLNLDLKVAIKEYYPNGFVSRDATHSTVNPFVGEPTEVFETGKSKFINEAKSLAKFRALPGIVAVNDFFMENGTAYIAMEYVEGQTLKTYLTTNKLSSQQVFDMMYSVMQSLAYVHQAGMIHRDISPDNIMITNDGQVKLLDFGAARDFADSGNKSLSVLLKLGYAPSEQYSSKGVQGPWTDIYALCATIYKIITGITPDESIDRLRKDEVKPPSQLGFPINPQHERALLKGMAVDMENRFQSIPELMSAIYPQKNSEVTVPYTEQKPQAKPVKPVTLPKQQKPSVQQKPVAKPVAARPARQAVAKEKKPLNKKLITGIACGVGAVLIAAVIALTLPKGEVQTTGEQPVSEHSQQAEVNKNSGIIPDVVNLPMEEAQERLFESMNDNQTFTTYFEYNPDIAKGLVMKQDNNYTPPADWDWDETIQLILLTVSLGADDGSPTQVRSIPYIEVAGSYYRGLHMNYVDPRDPDIEGFLVEISTDDGKTWKTIKNPQDYSSEESQYYFGPYRYREETANEPMMSYGFSNNLFSHLAMGAKNLEGVEFKLRLITMPRAGTGKKPGYTYVDTPIKITTTLPKPNFTVSKLDTSQLDLEKLKDSHPIFQNLIDDPNDEYLHPYKLTGDFKKDSVYLLAVNSSFTRGFKCITDGELTMLINDSAEVPGYATFGIMELASFDKIKKENGVWQINYSKPTIVDGTKENSRDLIYLNVEFLDSNFNEAGSTEVPMVINEYGNTMGNLTNGGKFAQQGDWIYYSDGDIWRIKTDGSGKQKIADELNDQAHFINVVGEYVYFLDADGGYLMNKLVRVKTDGSETKTLGVEYNYQKIIVSGDFIYGTKDNQIVKMQTDGTNEQVLADGSLQCLFGDTLYYNSDDGLTAIKTDGTGKKLLVEVRGDYAIADEEYLYYTDYSNKGSMYRIRKDGTDKQKLTDYTSTYMHLVGDYIYYNEYENTKNREHYLYKMRKDGSDKQKLIEDRAQDLEFCSDYMFMLNYTKQQYERMKLDGSERTVVSWADPFAD